MANSKKLKYPNISFIIPAFNTAQVIGDCLLSIGAAMQQVKVDSWEIIVADDGSTDNNIEVVKGYAKQLPIRVATFERNMGRIAARKAGIDKAKYDMICLIDTKTLLNEDSFAFLAEQYKSHPEREVWCPHVDSDTNNIVAAFNEGQVRLIWRRYLDNPRLVGFGLEEFDFYPKGGTCIVAPKARLLDSYKQFDLSENLKHASDDIPLLRGMAAKTKIWLSPKFRCFYRARTGMNQFIPWIYSRGKLFTDGHLRRGSRFNKYIVLLLLAPIAYIAVGFFYPWLLLSPLIIWLLAMAYLALRLPYKNWRAITLLSWIYALAFIGGIYVKVGGNLKKKWDNRL